jgi:hypothetical protein
MAHCSAGPDRSTDTVAAEVKGVGAGVDDASAARVLGKSSGLWVTISAAAAAARHRNAKALADLRSDGMGHLPSGACATAHLLRQQNET